MYCSPTGDTYFHDFYIMTLLIPYHNVSFQSKKVPEDSKINTCQIWVNIGKTDNCIIYSR